VFEIGSSLRATRERRGLSFEDVERDTCIRPRYLRALEDEAFQLLPSRAYAKAFLREYAEYLDLDGERLVDEFSSRFPPEQEPESKFVPAPAEIPRFRLSLTPIALITAALGAAAVAIWLIGVGGTSKHSPPTPRPQRGLKAITPPHQPPSPPTPHVARLTLTATTGACWLDAHAGSQTGADLHIGTLEPGQSLRLTGRRIWIRLGDPTVLVATLNGKKIRLPRATPVDVLVGPIGVKTTS
jgi:transcriptional regulator with XRE-family HTH domain